MNGEEAGLTWLRNAVTLKTAPRPAADGRQQAGRWRAWILLVAFVPSLTFAGHWPALAITIPFVRATIVVNLGGASRTGHDDGAASGQAQGDDAEQHARHCHADAASCSDIPFTGGSAFALLQDSVALLAAAATLSAIVGSCWLPHGSQSLFPEPPPPRLSFAMS